MRRIEKLTEERAALEKERGLVRQRKHEQPQPPQPPQQSEQLQPAPREEGDDREAGEELCDILRALELGQFACPEFLDCMRRVGVSLDPACMSGCDEHERLSLYVCLCDYVRCLASEARTRDSRCCLAAAASSHVTAGASHGSALNVHDAHEFLLHRELRKGR